MGKNTVTGDDTTTPTTYLILESDEKQKNTVWDEGLKEKGEELPGTCRRIQIWLWTHSAGVRKLHRLRYVRKEGGRKREHCPPHLIDIRVDKINGKN